MKILKDVLMCAVLLILAVAIGCAAWVLVPAAQEFLYVTRTSIEHMGAAADSVPVKVEMALGDVLEEVRELRLMVDRQATGARADVRGISGKLDGPLEAAGAAVAEIAEIRGDLQPLLAEVQRTAANVTLTTHDLRPQLLGLVAAGKVTLGQTAQTMRDIQRATPATLESFREIQLSVQRSASTFEVGFPSIVQNVGGITENVNRLTKPKWYDTALKFGVSGAAAYGALK